MIDFIYRFRTIESLFAFKELENQEIYFADPASLNDPLEDFKDIFWQGDETLWRNFFKNYLLCLQTIYVLVRIGGEDHLLNDSDIPVFTTYDKLPTPMYKDKMKGLFEDFFQQKNVATLIQGLKTRNTVRRDELLFYLEMIHPLCLHLIQKHNGTVKEKNGFTKPEPFLERLPSNFFDLLKESKNEKGFEDIMFGVAKHNLAQVKMLIQLNEEKKTSNNKKFCLFDFPQKYINQLENLMFWPWYTACFTKNPNNSSMWGYYTDGHKGVCLKFKTNKQREKPGIFLQTITGYGGRKGEFKKQYGKRFFELYDITYNNKLEPIDFFRSIGRLPFPDLIGQWYSDENQNVSPLVKDILESQDSWRNKYWKSFLSNIPIKTSEWIHEEEMRLIHHSLLDSTISEEDRVLKYDFDDLEGIIFGINTSDEAKLKIIKTVHDKCEKTKRTDFNFYQATYDNRTGKISHQKLGLIKFSF